jgi:transcriptional regulator with XRE-family HTH domain
MLFTAPELAAQLGSRVRARRQSLGLTQAEAAARSGVSYGTWRRLEASGKASIEDLARAALALRCEEGLATLFAPAPARTLTELLAQHKDATRGRRTTG